MERYPLKEKCISFQILHDVKSATELWTDFFKHRSVYTHPVQISVQESGGVMERLEAALADLQKKDATAQSGLDNCREGLKAEEKKKKELIKNQEEVSATNYLCRWLKLPVPLKWLKNDTPVYCHIHGDMIIALSLSFIYLLYELLFSIASWGEP